MMRTWHFYDSVSGKISSRYYSATNDRDLQWNTPEGQMAIEGRFDPLSQMVDVASGAVVDYQPPAPDSDHEWNATSRRWEKRAEVAKQEREMAQAAARIAALEVKQMRPIRELQIDPDNVEARSRLAEIEAQITMLRASLRKT